MSDCVVIHYSEIGLKGTNRPFFEKRLSDSITARTGLSVKKEYGKLVMDFDEKKIVLLSKIPGIAYYSPALKCRLDVNEFISKAKLLVKKGTFRITAQRSNKRFSLTSMQVNSKVGEALMSKDLKVKLESPDTEVFIEVGEKNAYVYSKKIKGMGGLPLKITGKVVALVSGGIDSPVACYEMIKRGCEVVMVHFFNKREGVKEKILELAKKISEYQGKVKVYTVPFLNVQKSIIMNVPARVRMIIYRRFMMRIAELILKKEKALGLVTGDNVGQVASQTLENLRSIWSVTNENIFAPLISRDKEETVNQAKRIGTFDISIKPYSDCCSYVIAQHPETKSHVIDIEKDEESLDVNDLVLKAFSEAEVEVISSL